MAIDLITTPVNSTVLPNYHGSESTVPRELLGAKIIAFGSLKNDRFYASSEREGLVIDYLVEGEKSPRRIVLGINDAGMWVVYNGPSNASIASIQA